jgi:hypothetical protein
MFTDNEQDIFVNSNARNLMQNKWRTEKEILADAMVCLKKVVPVNKVKQKLNEVRIGKHVADAEVQFTELLKPYYVEIRHQVRRKEIDAIQAFLDRIPKPNMLVTKHITPPLAEELRERDIQFLDTTGNMYIRQEKPFVHVYIAGKRDATRINRKPPGLFREAGLRIQFLLLCDPIAKMMTYREMTKATGLALGTVSNVITGLIHHGFIRVHEGERILTQKEYLMDKWAEAFPNELMPKLNPRRFATDKADWWKKIDFVKYDVLLGGEPAAAIMTEHLHPELATVYAGPGFAAFAKELELRKDDRGNLLVLDKFWHDVPAFPGHPGVVQPLLVYADLLATGDGRNIEIAQMIRKKFFV